MKKSQFVHLHVHSDYSLVNGMCKIKDIAKFANDNKMPAVALTDHATMAGCIEFYKEMQFYGIKAILGCEIYLIDDKTQELFHLTLLAENHSGYQNLCRLTAAIEIDKNSRKAVLRKSQLAKFADGIIALSGCIKGEVSRPILENKQNDAKTVLSEYIDIFGRDNFYLELSDHGMEIQQNANQGLIALSKEFDVKVVATNDVHYVSKEAAETHDLLRCIKNNTTVNDKTRYSFFGNEYFLKTADEMSAIFADIPEALTNTLEIAERCNVKIPLEDDIAYWPKYKLADNEKSAIGELFTLCMQSVTKKYGVRTSERKECMKRLDFELHIIEVNNFADYFLIIHDIAKFAKENNIPVGPGRGSAGGSIVCYLLGITDIDPIKYHLCFERFMNPENILPPDIDLDVCDSRRNEVIEYLYTQYGEKRVAKIAAYSEFKTISSLKAAGKALGQPASKVKTLVDAVYNSEGIIGLKNIYETSNEFRQIVESDKWAQEVFDYARKLEGLKMEQEIHSAGILIADRDLEEVIPLFPDKENPKRKISQYIARNCEELGILKIDLLGLKVLTDIQRISEQIKESNSEFDIAKIQINDEKTFELFKRGDTENVFQCESLGIQDLCKEFTIESIDDIIAIIAMYRPGIMEFIPEFIARKKGEVPIEYLDPKMKPILKETYGIMIYQEQIIEVIHKLSDISRGKADLIRRALGKKKISTMKNYFYDFINGCTQNGISSQTAEKIWDDLCKSSGYAFNKAHATGYALLAYQTAYLKANHV